MAKKEVKVTNKEGKESKNKKSFFKSLKAELKKVIWPTPKQLINNTVAVITIVLITAVIVFVLDFAFESLNKYGVDKIKESIQTIESTNSADDNTTMNETTNETTENENTSNTENTTNETVEENQNSSENNAQ